MVYILFQRNVAAGSAGAVPEKIYLSRMVISHPAVIGLSRTALESCSKAN